MSNSLKKIVVINHYRFLNFMLNIIQHMLFRKPKEQAIKKILVFRTGSVGDNICAMPALSVIRNNYPESQIDILTSSGGENLVPLESLIDISKFSRIINYFGIHKRVLFKQLFREKYDLFIELPQYKVPWLREVRNQLVVKLLGIKYAYGWRLSQTMLFPKWQEKHFPFTNERDRLLKILADNGLEVDHHTFLFSKDEKVKSRINSLLIQNDFIEKDKNIGIVIGNKLMQNRWPLSNFKEVIEYFANKSYKILLFGGPGEKEMAGTLTFAKTIHNFCGELLPIETVEAMKHCKVIITNDTGPMHMAYAVGIPVIALFSSRDFPGKWYPPDDGINRVFRTEGIHCSICFNRDCDDNICMQNIKVTQVIEATEQILIEKNNIDAG